jgi:hypothetical protein
MCEEADAALGLTRVLRKARAAAERMDAQGFDRALSESVSLAEALHHGGDRRSRLTAETARTLGLPADAGLARVVATLEPQAGHLGQTTDALRNRLGALAQESAALGVCARYGAAVVGHLSGLAASQPCYGPTGKARPAGRTV